MRWLVVILSVFFSARGAFSATPTPVEVKKLRASAFKALPDSALVEFDGKKMTKAQFISEREALRARMSAIKAPGGPKPALPDFSVRRASILEKEKARIVAKNARITFFAQESRQMIPTPTPDPCTQPRITAISGAPPLEPGEQVILNGCGFGLRHPASELRWVSNNFPGGHIKLQILEWRGNAILAVVPPISGVKDQPAKLQVVRKDLLVSNEWPASFYATRDVSLLGRADLARTCSQASTINNCSEYYYPGFTIAGNHYSGIAGYFEGTDSASANLKNGCVLAGAEWGWGGSNSTLTGDPTASLVFGSASISMSFAWAHWEAHTDVGGIYYLVNLWALGPAGVPCH